MPYVRTSPPDECIHDVLQAYTNEKKESSDKCLRQTKDF